VGSVHFFLFFTKGTARELQDSNSVKMFGRAVMSSLNVEGEVDSPPRGVPWKRLKTAKKSTKVARVLNMSLY
jgi:hypothetical protein